MGLGSTAKKLQGLSDRAEAMYKQVQELQKRITNLEEEVDDTHNTVNRMDHQLTEQRALLLAIADEHDLDGERILAEAAIDEADDLAAEGEDGDAEAADDTAGESEGTADGESDDVTAK